MLAKAVNMFELETALSKGACRESGSITEIRATLKRTDPRRLLIAISGAPIRIAEVETVNSGKVVISDRIMLPTNVVPQPVRIARLFPRVESQMPATTTSNAKNINLVRTEGNFSFV